jgi:hypothetical protein
MILTIKWSTVPQAVPPPPGSGPKPIPPPPCIPSPTTGRCQAGQGPTSIKEGSKSCGGPNQPSCGSLGLMTALGLDGADAIQQARVLDNVLMNAAELANAAKCAKKGGMYNPQTKRCLTAGDIKAAIGAAK